jgi:hypothetical protein
MRFVLRAAVGLACIGHVCVAQTPAGLTSPRATASLIHQARAAAVQPDGGGALLIEALGGTVGSLVGIGIIGLTANCGVDDLGCVILNVGAGGLLGAIGATVGTTLAARYTGSRRSVLGAALGAVVGTGAGLGIHYVFNQSSDRNLGDAVVVPIFVVSQGVFAALGSRLFGAAASMR